MIGCDIVEKVPIEGVDFQQGDFHDLNVLTDLLARFGEFKVEPK